MTTTLITGANRGLGLATARRLVQAGHTVYLGARDLAASQEAARQVGGRPVQLDVTDASSVAAAAAQLTEEAGQLDVLINNAGIISTGSESLPTAEETQQVLDTNVVGTVRVTLDFLPLLKRSTAPRIINVGSGMGSFGLTSDPERFESSGIVPAYSASKAAVHMLTAQYAKALPEMEVNAVDPGYTATDMTQGRGQPVEDGIEAIVRLAVHGNGGVSGTLTDRHGPLPW